MTQSFSFRNQNLQLGTLSNQVVLWSNTKQAQPRMEMRGPQALPHNCANGPLSSTNLGTFET